MEKWLSTLDTREAAAFATLGVPVKILSSLHERTGRKVVRFLLSPVSVDGIYHTGKLRLAIKNGTLLKNDPGHPLITILRAYHNREALLGLIKRATPLRLVQVHGTSVWQYVPGDTGLPGLAGEPACVRTADVNLAAALATVGLQVLQLSGPSEKLLFTIAAFGPAGVDGAWLTQEWRRDPAAVDWKQPFAQSARGLRNRSLLRQEVARAIDDVILSKPGTHAHAILRADSSPAAWDKTARFFAGA